MKRIKSESTDINVKGLIVLQVSALSGTCHHISTVGTTVKDEEEKEHEMELPLHWYIISPVSTEHNSWRGESWTLAYSYEQLLRLITCRFLNSSLEDEGTAFPPLELLKDHLFLSSDQKWGLISPGC